MTSFEYRIQARSPANYFAFFVSGLMIAVAWVAQASTIVWPVVLGYFALVTWRLATNPTTGFRIVGEQIETLSAGRRHSIALHDIVEVVIARNAGGQPTCVMQLRQGRSLALPCADRFDPLDLRRQFLAVGIPVRI